MKICYVGGNAPRLFNLMKDMKERGHDIYWISWGKPKFKIPGIKIEKSIKLQNKNTFQRIILAPYYFLVFRKIIKNISPDILHAINIEWAGWFSVFSGNKNVYVSTQGSDVMVRKNMKNDLIRRWLRKLTIKKASVITYGTNAMLKDIMVWSQPKEILNYYAGVNLDLFNFDERKREVREKYDIGRRRTVFCPRTFDENSNIDIVVSTIPKVIKYFPDVIYMFVFHQKNNIYTKKILMLIKKLQVSNRCIFLNEASPDEMVAYYLLSDIVLSIPSSDGMPATLLEAMAMKNSLVITDIPSYNELMKKKYANIVKIRNIEETSDAIIECLKNNTENEYMKVNALNWVKSKANYKKLNDLLEKRYLKSLV